MKLRLRFVFLKLLGDKTGIRYENGPRKKQALRENKANEKRSCGVKTYEKPCKKREMELYGES